MNRGRICMQSFGILASTLGAGEGQIVLLPMADALHALLAPRTMKTLCFCVGDAVLHFDSSLKKLKRAPLRAPARQMCSGFLAAGRPATAFLLKSKLVFVLEDNWSMVLVSIGFDAHKLTGAVAMAKVSNTEVAVTFALSGTIGLFCSKTGNLVKSMRVAAPPEQPPKKDFLGPNILNEITCVRTKPDSYYLVVTLGNGIAVVDPTKIKSLIRGHRDVVTASDICRSPMRLAKWSEEGVQAKVIPTSLQGSSLLVVSHESRFTLVCIAPDGDIGFLFPHHKLRYATAWFDVGKDLVEFDYFYDMDRAVPNKISSLITMSDGGVLALTSARNESSLFRFVLPSAGDDDDASATAKKKKATPQLKEDAMYKIPYDIPAVHSVALVQLPENF